MKKILSLMVVIIVILLSVNITVSADIQITDINSGWHWPTASKTITSEFGRARPTTSYPNRVHQAIDIAGSEGSTVYATRTGDVVETFSSCKGSHNSGSCSCSGGSYYGNYVVIYHGMWNGHKIYSMYMHLKSVSVNVGTSVQAKQEIGKIGNTGPSDGAHLHFQISKGSKNPSHNSMTQAENNFINTNPDEVMFANKIFSHNRIGTSSYPNSKYGDIIYIMDGVNVPPPDTEAPTISNLRVENISGDSFTIKCNLNDNVGVTRVWYVLYAPGGTYEFGDSASNGYYSKKLETKNYGGAGKYSFHLYAFDVAGNQVKEVYSSFSVYDEELPLNIGDDFYATIIHTESWKPITRDDDGFIRLRSEKGSANQVWRFRRQDDGSYTIASTGDNKLLEMYCGITDNNNPAAVCSEDWGGAYQRWYIFKQGNGYILQSKHYTSLNRVLTLQGFDTSDGMAVQTCVRTNLSTQIFSIYQGADIQMKSPTLSYITDGVMTTFSWNDIYGESGYDLLIYKDGNLYNSVRIVSGNQCTYTQYLPIGNYTAHVQAFNAYEYKQSDTISISIAPLDIGTDFYATILHSDQWKPITYDSDKFVRLHDETTNSNQVWYFRRQNDGSYTIASAGDNKLLEMFCGITDNNNPVTVSSEDWGAAYQRWYIFRQGNGNRYILLSKHNTHLGRVLTLNDTKLQTCDANNDTNKCFSIYSSSGIQLSSPILNVHQNGLNTTFSWSNVNCESGYDLLIYKDNTLYRQVRILADEPRIYSEYLPEGDYSSHVQAFNAYEYKQSADVIFNVSSKDICSKSVVQKNNNKYNVNTIVYKDFSGQLIVAGYKNNRLVQIEIKSYTEKPVETTLSGDIDEIKVMVWNSLSGMVPLCEAEVIPSSEFIV